MTGQPVTLVPVKIDNAAHLRLIVQTMLLHLREMQQIERDRASREPRML
jgi:hypothetical protein